MQNHYLNVIKALQGSDYVVIGGFAAIMYGSNRFTPDINLVVDFDTTNVAAILVRLGDLGLSNSARINVADLPDLRARQEWIAEYRWRSLSLKSPDILGFSVEIELNPPLPYAELVSDCLNFQYSTAQARLCSLAKLLEMKKMANRPQDQVDLDNLEVSEALKITNNDPAAVELVFTKYQDTFERNRLEHLHDFNLLESDQKIEWLSNMLEAISQSMIGNFF